ncbi:MAG: Two-component system response regulator [Deltaproteobacteria bacterium]|jgi:CheY-like chemotaxis protein|nr:Two-component system response regulator [Deltaproteobacteria bacterium]
MNSARGGRPIHILMAEDNPDDIELTIEALKDSRVRNRLIVVKDGEEAISYLQGNGKYQHAVRPDLILLDLNMPKKNGRDVLREIKNDPKLRRIPVVILTTSQEEDDIAYTYDLHANCYITKPLDFNQFLKVVKSIEDFWLTVVRLPPQ